MKVLIGCEYSGIVRDAFIEKGHHAMSCDLLPSESPGPHYQGDIMDLINEGWDMLIAFPPCTYLCTTANRYFLNNPYRWEKRLEAVKFAYALWTSDIARISLENPKGVLPQYIGKSDQIVHPYYFGDPHPKETHLWLKGLPKLTHTDYNTFFQDKTHVDPVFVEYNSKKSKSGKSKYSVHGKLGRGHGKEKSKFWPGMALAMADQWGNL